jgi:hypothetical protein
MPVKMEIKIMLMTKSDMELARINFIIMAIIRPINAMKKKLPQASLMLSLVKKQ